MDFRLSSQLSLCQWVSLRCLLLCRQVVERDIPNASVTGREGVRIPQGTCSHDGNGVGSGAVVNMWPETRVSLPLQECSLSTGQWWVTCSASGRSMRFLRAVLGFIFSALRDHIQLGLRHRRSHVPKIPLVEGVSPE